MGFLVFPGWTVREVKSPLTAEMLEPFTASAGTVYFNSTLTDSDCMRLADWMRNYPELGLRVGDGIDDLEFLRFFPFIRHFGAAVVYRSIGSIDGLRHLSENLESLDLGHTRRQLDLTILSRFPGLKQLKLQGPTKGIGVISNLTALEDLTLRSITLQDLSLLLPLTELRALDIKLGGTTDLSLLPSIGRLQYLDLWMIRGLSHLSSIGRLPHPRGLFLQALRRVEALPDLSLDVELRRVHLETMRGLRDLRPLATAPALEQLLLVDFAHLQPEDLRCLVGLPHLEGVGVGLGSKRKNDAAYAMLQLPDATNLKTGDWREV